MPPHRKTRWMVGLIIAPFLMAGFSAAFNLKSHNVLLRLAVALMVAVILSSVTDHLYFTVFYWINSGIVTYYFWKKLPEGIKQDGW